MVADSRITLANARWADDGAKVILLDPIPAVLAYAGEVNFGELSLALAAKLARQEPSPTLDKIKELTLTAFGRFYRRGRSLWGLLGAVSSNGSSDSIWSLGPHNGRDMTAQLVHSPAMIGDPKAQAAYERCREKHWTSLGTMRLGPMNVAIDSAQRQCIIFDYAIDEMSQTGQSTIGRPIQAFLITKDRWLALGSGKYNQGKDEWEQVHPKRGEVRFRHREYDLRDLRPLVSELRKRKPD
ncbi:MAG: hypothetical protein IH977_02510 [Nitrospinae bacterium]|nr:hypothetical protein [Nitrospinota bacterium]